MESLIFGCGRELVGAVLIVSLTKRKDDSKSINVLVLTNVSLKM